MPYASIHGSRLNFPSAGCLTIYILSFWKLSGELLIVAGLATLILSLRTTLTARSGYDLLQAVYALNSHHLHPIRSQFMCRTVR
jgi:hypothetical protein